MNDTFAVNDGGWIKRTVLFLTAKLSILDFFLPPVSTFIIKTNLSYNLDIILLDYVS